MKILVIEPEAAPYVKEVSNNLKDLQSVVGGYLQAIYPFNDDLALVCNENGKMLGLTPNRVLVGNNSYNESYFDIIFGTFFIVGIGTEDFEDLPEELIEKYSRIFTDYYAKIYC